MPKLQLIFAGKLSPVSNWIYNITHKYKDGISVFYLVISIP